jgi:hypothetical protein
MNFAKLKIDEVPMAVRAEMEADDLIQEALHESGLYDEILESVQSGGGEISDQLHIAFEHLLNAFRIYKRLTRSASKRGIEPKHCGVGGRTMADFGRLNF